MEVLKGIWMWILASLHSMYASQHSWVIKRKCVCVLVRHRVTRRYPDARCHFVSPFKTHKDTPAANMPLCIFILLGGAGLPRSLSSCRSLPQPPFAQLQLLSYCPCFLPLPSQMGWVESWLRTFMPKTTCHPSLLLSRMVMLWEVSTVRYMASDFKYIPDRYVADQNFWFVFALVFVFVWELCINFNILTSNQAPRTCNFSCLKYMGTKIYTSSSWSPQNVHMIELLLIKANIKRQFFNSFLYSFYCILLFVKYRFTHHWIKLFKLLQTLILN